MTVMQTLIKTDKPVWLSRNMNSVYLTLCIRCWSHWQLGRLNILYLTLSSVFYIVTLFALGRKVLRYLHVLRH